MDNKTREYVRVREKLQKRKDKVESGGINCIPFGLPALETKLPGLEQGKMVCVTANSKVGKTQITDYMFLYSPIFFAKTHPNINVKIFYFTLEMSKEEKYIQLMCHLLFKLSKGKIRVDPITLRSTSKGIEQEILEILDSEEYQEYFKFFEDHVEFIDSIRNPFGMYKIGREYAIKNGKQYSKTINKEGVAIEIDDYYEQDNPNEYRIIIVDHLALMSQENNMSLRDTISKWTSHYSLLLRNKYNFDIIDVQQQSSAQESNDNFKMNKLKPTLDGLGDVKTTQRDFNYILGLFSPYRHGIAKYEGYDITKFKDNIRFLEIIASREGGGGSTVPLYFDGGVNYFHELPPANEANNTVDSLLRRAKNPSTIDNSLLLMNISMKRKFTFLHNLFKF